MNSDPLLIALDQRDSAHDSAERDYMREWMGDAAPPDPLPSAPLRTDLLFWLLIANGVIGDLPALDGITDVDYMSEWIGEELPF